VRFGRPGAGPLQDIERRPGREARKDARAGAAARLWAHQ